MAWRIFRHALLMLQSNIRMALRVSWLYFALNVLIIVAGFLWFKVVASASNVDVSSIFRLLTILDVVNGVLLLSISASWMRYLLTGETRWRDVETRWPKAFFLYFWAVSKLALLILSACVANLALWVVILLLLGQFVSETSMAFHALRYLLLFGLAALPALYLGLRLGITLPACALGHQTGIQGTWIAMKPAHWLIWKLTGLSALALVPYYALQWILQKIGVAILPVAFIVDWLFVMAVFSLLATLYGYLVEGRDLR